MEPPLSPDHLAEVTRRAKRQIRQRMKALRASIPSPQRAEKSQAIVRALLELPEVRDARAVALFWPLEERGEVDLRELDAALRARGVRVYYPVQEPGDGGAFFTGFRLTESLTDLAERGSRFLEPPPTSPLGARGDVDVVVVPALAVDAAGQRTGYGAGYYDATLADVCPPALAVIVAFDFQLLAELPVEPHDVAGDIVVTDRRVLRPAAAER